MSEPTSEERILGQIAANHSERIVRLEQTVTAMVWWNIITLVLATLWGLLAFATRSVAIAFVASWVAYSWRLEWITL